MKSLSGALLLVLTTCGGALAQPAAPAPGAPVSPAEGATLPRVAVIATGATVQIEYTLKDDAGNVLDSNKGEAPLTFTQGNHRLFPRLEKALDGMHAGEEKSVTLAPEDGYGPVLPDAQTEVPRDVIPADSLQVGAELVARSQAGEQRVVRVKEVKDSTVVLDLNHPLAGKTLHFDVRVINVTAPQKP